MLESSLPRVTVSPAEIVKRRTASWRGVSAEIVQFTGEQPIEYEYRSRFPLFIACQRAFRSDGKTYIDGLHPSTLREFSRKMLFVPANHTFKGRYVPRVQLRTTYFYLDLTELSVDSELDLSRVDFAPRLFFDDPALWSTAEKLTATIEASPGESRLYAEALTAVLALELIRLERGIHLPQAAARGGLAAWQERTARDYIDAHLADDIALADLAAIAKLSPAHFCRAFKASVGMPPHRYQMERRIEEAKTLLARPQQSILEIALACGFGFSSSFTKAFRKATGVTPSAFRRALQ
ncbi:MAG: helix-turn-helix transcriptional regulator [Alphaproteobacteria bacterium]|nr:helix-turn-helix transcriptional regulator [Alphaproteobacteria bacterium]